MISIHVNSTMFLIVVTLQLIAVGHGAYVEMEEAFQEFVRT